MPQPTEKLPFSRPYVYDGPIRLKADIVANRIAREHESQGEANNLQSFNHVWMVVDKLGDSSTNPRNSENTVVWMELYNDEPWWFKTSNVFDQVTPFPPPASLNRLRFAIPLQKLLNVLAQRSQRVEKPHLSLDEMPLESRLKNYIFGVRIPPPMVSAYHTICAGHLHNWQTITDPASSGDTPVPQGQSKRWNVHRGCVPVRAFDGPRLQRITSSRQVQVQSRPNVLVAGRATSTTSPPPRPPSSTSYEVPAFSKGKSPLAAASPLPIPRLPSSVARTPASRNSPLSAPSPPRSQVAVTTSAADRATFAMTVTRIEEYYDRKANAIRSMAILWFDKTDSRRPEFLSASLHTVDGTSVKIGDYMPMRLRFCTKLANLNDTIGPLKEGMIVSVQISPPNATEIEARMAQLSRDSTFIWSFANCSVRKVLDDSKTPDFQEAINQIAGTPSGSHSQYQPHHWPTPRYDQRLPFAHAGWGMFPEVPSHNAMPPHSGQRNLGNPHTQMSGPTPASRPPGMSQWPDRYGAGPSR